MHNRAQHILKINDLRTSLQGAGVEIVLKAWGNEDKDKVEKEHGEAHALGHFPVEYENGHKDEDQHAKKDGDGAHHARRRHGNVLLENQCINEPGKW